MSYSKRCLEEDNYKCRVWGCGCTENLEAHHIIPRGHKINELWNLITLCRKHHKMITDGKMKNTDMLIKLKNHEDFRWQKALDWQLNREEIRTRDNSK